MSCYKWEVKEIYVAVNETELLAIAEGRAQLGNGKEYEHAAAVERVCH